MCKWWVDSKSPYCANWITVNGKKIYKTKCKFELPSLDWILGLTGTRKIPLNKYKERLHEKF